MLTWRERTLLMYNASTLALVSETSFSTTTGEGWGITFDGQQLIVSDGSSFLHFWDPHTLPQVKELAPRVQVRVGDGRGAACVHEPPCTCGVPSSRQQIS